MNWFDRFKRQPGRHPAPNPSPDSSGLHEALEAGLRAKRAEDYDLALESLRRASSLAVTDATALAVVTLNRAEVLTARGDDDEAQHLLETACDNARANNQRAHLAYLLCGLGALAQARGNWDLARQHYESALESARLAGAIGAEARAQGHLAETYWREGNASYAAHLLREALPKLTLAGDVEAGCLFVGLLGQALVDSGQPADGYALIERALRLSQQLGYRRYQRRWSIALGRRALAEGRFSDAVGHFETAFALYPPDSADPDFLRALCEASRAYLGLRQTQPAIAHARRAVEHAARLADPHLAAQTHSALGQAILASGDHSEAAGHLHTAAEAFRGLSAPAAEEIDALRSLAEAYGELGDDQQALALYQDAIARAEAHAALSVRAQAHRDLGLFYVRQRQMQQAIREWTTALAYYERENHPAQVARLYCDIAAARRFVGQGARALKDYEQALMALNDLRDDWTTRGLVLANAAIAYAEHGDVQSTESFFSEAIRIAQRTGDEAAEAVRRGNYGWFLLQLGRIPQAIASLQAALRISQLRQMTLQAAVQTDNLGLAHDAQGDYTAALDYHRRALEQIAGLRQPHWQHIIQANLAETLLSLDQLEEATPLFDAALAQGRADEDVELIVRGLLGQAQVALRQDRPQAAEPLLEEAAALARKAALRRLHAEALALHSQQQAALNQEAQAAALWDEARKLYAMLHMPQARLHPAWLNGRQLESPSSPPPN